MDCSLALNTAKAEWDCRDCLRPLRADPLRRRCGEVDEAGEAERERRFLCTPAFKFT